MFERKRLIDLLIGVMAVAMIIFIVLAVKQGAPTVAVKSNSTLPQPIVVIPEVASSTTSSKTFATEEEMRTYLKSILPAGTDVQSIIEHAKKQ